MGASSVGGIGNSFLPGEQASRSIDYSEIVRPHRARELYNPNPEAPVQFGYNGEVYTLPPADKLLQMRDPFTNRRMIYPKPGVLPLYDIRFSVRGQRIVITADDLIEVACGKDGRSGQIGMLGVRPLFGDERDEAVILEAQEAYGEQRDIVAVDRTRTHESNVALARDNGAVPPRPSQEVMLDYQWLAQRDLSRSLRFSCEVCYLGFHEEKEMLVHIVAHHKKHPAAVEAERALGITGAAAAVPTFTPKAPMSPEQIEAMNQGMAEGSALLDGVPDALDAPPTAAVFNAGGSVQPETDAEAEEEDGDLPAAGPEETIAPGAAATTVDAPKPGGNIPPQGKKSKSR